MSAQIVTQFLRLRRSIRQHQALLDRASATRAMLLRQAKVLDAGLPFDRARAATYRARHENINPFWHAGIERRHALGRQLLAMAPDFDAATSPAQRLDLLNVNVVDRASITPGAGLVMIVAGYCLEIQRRAGARSSPTGRCSTASTWRSSSPWPAAPRAARQPTKSSPTSSGRRCSTCWTRSRSCNWSAPHQPPPKEFEMNMNEIRTFIRLPAVIAATDLPKSTIYEKSKAGTFPAPIQIGPRAVAWDAGAIAAWQVACIAAAGLTST